MSNELQDIALAEAYANNELNDQERVAVEVRRDKDPDFARLLVDMKVLLEGTRSAFREDVEAQLRDLEAGLPTVQMDEAALLLNDLPELEETISTSKPKRPFRYWLYRAAAVLIPLFVGLGWWMSSEKPAYEKLFEQHFETLDHDIHLTRGNEDKSYFQLQVQALSEFKQGQYAKAIPLFQQLFDVHDDTSSLFYLAIAQLGDNQPTTAIQNLERFKNISDDIRFTNLDYYLALAYLRKGDLKKAREFLANAKSREAIKLKGDLDKL